jgi:L-xylulokinase
LGKYLLSIDNGLTAIKVVLFDLSGQELFSGSARTAVITEGNRSEIDMPELWEMTARLICSVISTSGINPEDILGVGNSGHGAGLYLIDTWHQPVRPAITSMDTRSLPLLAKWQKEGRTGQDFLHQAFWSGQAIPLLAWLKQHEPENYQATAWILSAKDWIIERLTGKPGIEYSDVSNAGLIGLESRQAEPELLRRFGIADCAVKLPGIRKSTEIAGKVTPVAAAKTGLLEGTPVAGGVFDCAACAIGSGADSRNSYSLIAGTWNINAAIGPQLCPILQTTKCSLYPDAKQYFYVESSATSAVNLDWFIQNLIQGLALVDLSENELYEKINASVASISPGESDLIYLPLLYPSGLAEHLRASLIGLRPEHTIKHILRAVYEGITFAHRLHIERLMAAGIERQSAILTGGAANSQVWCQMFADILGLPVTTTRAAQAGALGTALCTAVALGCFASLEDANGQMVHDKAHFQPNADLLKIYESKYQQFQRIIRHCDQPFIRQG